MDCLGIVALKQVETGCKRIGSVAVEVICSHLKLRVVDEVDSFKKVLLNEVVSFFYVVQIL